MFYMKIKDLPSEDFMDLSHAFEDEVGEDLMKCWGDKTIETMYNIYHGDLEESNPNITLF